MVTVRASDGVVSVRLLLETPVGLALYEGDGYSRIGQILPAVWQDKNERLGVTTTRHGFRWIYDESQYGALQGEERTKKEALRKLLEAGGYVEAPPNSTNQGLW